MDKPKPRATDEELQERLDTICRYLIDGWSQSQVVRYVTDPERLAWDVTRRQARNYVYQARELLAREASEIDLRALYLMQLSRYTTLYREAHKEGNRRDAIKALQCIDELAKRPPVSINWKEELAQRGFEPAEEFEQLLNRLSGGDETQK